MKVAIKYCGSCNPVINLSGAGRDLRNAIGSDDSLLLVSPDRGDIDTMVILCGCARSCANREEIRNRAKSVILTAGETIDMRPVAEEDICAAVMGKIGGAV